MTQAATENAEKAVVPKTLRRKLQKAMKDSPQAWDQALYELADSTSSDASDERLSATVCQQDGLPRICLLPVGATLTEEDKTMFNIYEETLLPLTEAAAHVPALSHSSTVQRWFLRGIRGIRLETVLIGGKRYTSAEVLDRFYRAINGCPRKRNLVR